MLFLLGVGFFFLVCAGSILGVVAFFRQGNTGRDPRDLEEILRELQAVRSRILDVQRMERRLKKLEQAAKEHGWEMAAETSAEKPRPVIEQASVPLPVNAPRQKPASPTETPDRAQVPPPVPPQQGVVHQAAMPGEVSPFKKQSESAPAFATTALPVPEVKIKPEPRPGALPVAAMKITTPTDSVAAEPVTSVPPAPPSEKPIPPMARESVPVSESSPPRGAASAPPVLPRASQEPSPQPPPASAPPIPHKAGSDEPDESWVSRWALRAGAVLGVLAVMFLVYQLNLNSPPWLRWSGLMTFAAGLAVFGRMGSKRGWILAQPARPAGLALAHLGVFAGHAFPAVRVFESPLAGAVALTVSTVVLGLLCLWENRPKTCAMILAIGQICGLILQNDVGGVWLPAQGLGLLALAAWMRARRGWELCLSIAFVGHVGQLAQATLAGGAGGIPVETFTGLAIAGWLITTVSELLAVRKKPGKPLEALRLSLPAGLGALLSVVYAQKFGTEPNLWPLWLVWTGLFAGASFLARRAAPGSGAAATFELQAWAALAATLAARWVGEARWIALMVEALVLLWRNSQAGGLWKRGAAWVLWSWALLEFAFWRHSQDLWLAGWWEHPSLPTGAELRPLALHLLMLGLATAWLGLISRWKQAVEEIGGWERALAMLGAIGVAVALAFGNPLSPASVSLVLLGAALAWAGFRVLFPQAGLGWAASGAWVLASCAALASCRWGLLGFPSPTVADPAQPWALGAALLTGLAFLPLLPAGVFRGGAGLVAGFLGAALLEQFHLGAMPPLAVWAALLAVLPWLVRESAWSVLRAGVACGSIWFLPVLVHATVAGQTLWSHFLAGAALLAVAFVRLRLDPQDLPLRFGTCAAFLVGLAQLNLAGSALATALTCGALVLASTAALRPLSWVLALNSLIAFLFWRTNHHLWIPGWWSHREFPAWEQLQPIAAHTLMFVLANLWAGQLARWKSAGKGIFSPEPPLALLFAVVIGFRMLVGDPLSGPQIALVLLVLALIWGGLRRLFPEAGMGVCGAVAWTLSAGTALFSTRAVVLASWDTLATVVEVPPRDPALIPALVSVLISGLAFLPRVKAGPVRDAAGFILGTLGVALLGLMDVPFLPPLGVVAVLVIALPCLVKENVWGVLRAGLAWGSLWLLPEVWDHFDSAENNWPQLASGLALLAAAWWQIKTDEGHRLRRHGLYAAGFLGILAVQSSALPDVATLIDASLALVGALLLRNSARPGWPWQISLGLVGIWQMVGLAARRSPGLLTDHVILGVSLFLLVGALAASVVRNARLPLAARHVVLLLGALLLPIGWQYSWTHHIWPFGAAVSLGWSIVPVVFLAAGVGFRLRPWRIAGGLWLVPLFLRVLAVDLADTTQRVIAVGALSVVLLLVGWGYRRAAGWLREDGC